MQKVLSAEEMREVDRLTTEKYGIPSILLMENAAHAAACVITEKLGGSVKGKSFLVVCGKGNNGGDGAALARILWNQGASVEIFLFGKVEDTKGDARINFEIAKRIDNDEEINFFRRPNFFFSEIEDSSTYFEKIFSCHEDVYIDALFGTGLSRKVEGDLADVIRRINNFIPRGRRSFIVSLDLPSGINADSGYFYSSKFGGVELENDAGTAAQPDLTITFTAPKLANVLPPAANASKELITVNIGSPELLIEDSPSKIFLTEKQDARLWLGNTGFYSSSYKNKRGHALLIVGSKNYTGAAVLAGNATMLSGVGLTTIATAKSAQTGISAKALEEIITRGLAETKGGAIAEEAFEIVEKIAEKVDVIGIGCGLGSEEKTTRDFVRRVVEKRRTPVVIDADGLNALAPFDLKGADALPLVLTPHEGEFLRLLGTKDKDALKDRIAAAREFAQKHHVILVLKGERSLITEPGGTVVINPTGNSGLGKAGNGDTLSGIITGFIAQMMTTGPFSAGNNDQSLEKVFESVVAAVYIAGLAGDIAEKKFGKRAMLASDVRDCLAEAFRQLGEYE